MWETSERTTHKAPAAPCGHAAAPRLLLTHDKVLAQLLDDLHHSTAAVWETGGQSHCRHDDVHRRGGASAARNLAADPAPGAPALRLQQLQVGAGQPAVLVGVWVQVHLQQHRGTEGQGVIGQRRRRQ